MRFYRSPLTQRPARLGCSILALVSFVALAASSDASASGLDDALAGRSAIEEHRYDDALRLFTRAINSGELSPRDLAGAHYGRGIAYAEKQNYNLAIAEFGEMIRFRPDYSPAYFNRGLAYVYTEKYDEAERDLSKAIELTPGYQEAYVNRGTVYYLTKQYEKAITDFKTAIRLNPQDPISYNKIGIAYVASGKWIWSCGNFKRAIELDPDFQDAIHNYRDQCSQR